MTLPYPMVLGFNLFSASILKSFLGSDDNTVIVNNIVTLENLSYKPHIPKGIFYSRTIILHFKQIHQFKIKCMDRSIYDDTWECASVTMTTSLYVGREGKDIVWFLTMLI